MVSIGYYVVMFIRTKKTPRSKSISVQLVESFRLNGKNKQRVIHHFGTADTKEKLALLLQLAETMKHDVAISKARNCKPTKANRCSGNFIGELLEASSNTSLNISDVEEIGRYITGIKDAYGAVYDRIGFTNPFSHPSRRTYAAKILREIVLARIAFASSKRASVDLLDKQFGEKINLDHVYQMMDKIDDKFCENIQKIAFTNAVKLTQNKVKILFYDATTLYFESFSEDELKQNGYSKDMKFNQPQVLLALFATEKGLPLGYELFPGGTYEGHTLIPILEKLKKTYQVEQLVFVADRGLLSDENIKYLEENNFSYIVGARIKNLPKKLQEQILDEDNYHVDYGQKLGVFDYRKSKLIVSYAADRARKDQHDRSTAINKLSKKLAKNKNPKSLLSNYGYKKYITINGDAEIAVNEEKLNNDAKWDGLLGVVTNLQNALPTEILAQYRSLWQIEECFRINKHDLKMRPIYHWAPHRVKAHVAISFIAFVCVRYLEYLIAIQSYKISPAVIRDSLLQVQASVIRDKKTDAHFLLPSQMDAHAKEIYRVLRIKRPKTVMSIKCSA